MAQAGPSGAASAPLTADPAVPTKPCSKCKVVKPTTQFWKDPTKKSGHTSWCKGCFAESAERRKIEGPPVLVTERQCSICKVVKPADAFMKDSRRITGLDARCRECRRLQHAARKQRNLDLKQQAWEEKECRRCHVVKPASEFKKHAYTASGLDSWCKSCCRERRKQLLKERAAQATGVDGEHSTGSEGAHDEHAELRRSARKSKRICVTPPSPASPAPEQYGSGLALSAPAMGMLSAAEALQQLLAPLAANTATGTRAPGLTTPAAAPTTPGVPATSVPASPTAAAFATSAQPWSAGSAVPSTSLAPASGPQPPSTAPRGTGRVSAFASGTPAFPTYVFVPVKTDDDSGSYPAPGPVTTTFVPVQPPTANPPVSTWAGPAPAAPQLPQAAPLDLGAVWRAGGPAPFTTGGSPSSSPALAGRLSAPPVVQSHGPTITSVQPGAGPARGDVAGTTLDALFPDMWTERQDSLVGLLGGGSAGPPDGTRRVDSLLGTFLPPAGNINSLAHGGLSALPGAERGTSFSFSLNPGASRGNSLIGAGHALRIDSFLDWPQSGGAGPGASEPAMQAAAGAAGPMGAPGAKPVGTLASSTSAPALMALGVGTAAPAVPVLSVGASASREASLIQALASPGGGGDGTPAGIPAGIASAFAGAGWRGGVRAGVPGAAPGPAVTAARNDSLVNLDLALAAAEDIVLPNGLPGLGNGGGGNGGAPPGMISNLDLDRLGSLGLADMQWTPPNNNSA